MLAETCRKIYAEKRSNTREGKSGKEGFNNHFSDGYDYVGGARDGGGRKNIYSRNARSKVPQYLC